jgi:hypothetical protein
MTPRRRNSVKPGSPLPARPFSNPRRGNCLSMCCLAETYAVGAVSVCGRAGGGPLWPRCRIPQLLPSRMTTGSGARFGAQWTEWLGRKRCDGFSKIQLIAQEGDSKRGILDPEHKALAYRRRPVPQSPCALVALDRMAAAARPPEHVERSNPRRGSGRKRSRPRALSPVDRSAGGPSSFRNRQKPTRPRWLPRSRLSRLAFSKRPLEPATPG